MKRRYDSGASKRKRHEHAINELSKQKNSLDAFVSRKHVHDDEENLDYAVSELAAVTFNVTVNTDTEDNSGHEQSSTNVNVTVGDNFLETGTRSKLPSMTSSFLTEVDYHSDYYEIQAEIPQTGQTNANNTEFNLD